ncbi:MAG: helix-turn-helix domain-containing protein [Lachnospiraceae bacterium]
MQQINQTGKEYFPFFKQLITDAFQADCIYLEFPYENMDEIDRGFRKTIWNTYPLPNSASFMMEPVSEYHLYVVKSNLGFYNILATLTLEKNADILSIGPFLDEDITPTFLGTILKDAQVSSKTLLSLKQFYHTLPKVNVNAVVTLTMHLLSVIIPEFSDIIPKFMNFSDSTNKVQPQAFEIAKFTSQYAERYASLSNDYFDSLTKGDINKTSQRLNLILEFSGILSLGSLSKLKRRVHSINESCKTKILETTVPAALVLDLSQIYEDRIESATSRQTLAALTSEISRKYCLLAKNYSFSEYTFLTRSVILYIQEHLEEELTLSILSDQFKKNASFLSNAFSRETGISLTNYIHKERIQASIRYLATTNLPISSISSCVGFQDFNYYSRLFKKQIGTSPSEYRKMILKM